jgi:hypothetical protein
MISVCDSIPIEIPILWSRVVMVGPRPRVLPTLPLDIARAVRYVITDTSEEMQQKVSDIFHKSGNMYAMWQETI